MAIIRVPQDAGSINSAISLANPGDVILVSAGIYSESVVVNKSNIRIVSESAYQATLVGNGNASVGVFLDHVTNVEIFGFSISHFIDASLSIVGGGNHHLLNNQFLGTNLVTVSGLSIDSSVGNLIWNNEITQNQEGIQITGSSDNNWFINNTISFNGDNGIVVMAGDHNCFIQNSLVTNTNGIVSFSENTLFHENDLHANFSFGILMRNKGHNLITNNTAVNNLDGYGAIADSPHNYFFGNFANLNTTSSFTISSGNDFPTLVNNQGLKSSTGAIVEADFGNVNGNQFNNGNIGIDVSGNNNNIYFNSMQNNSQFDIQNTGTNNTFEGNQCSSSNPPGLC